MGIDETKLAEIRAALQDIEPGVWTIGLSSIHSRNGEQTIADHIPDTGTLRFLANSPRFVGDLLTIVTALSAEKQELAMQALSLSGELETLQSELAATRNALELAQKWMVNSVPTKEIDGPKPLPVIADILDPHR